MSPDTLTVRGAALESDVSKTVAQSAASRGARKRQVAPILRGQEVLGVDEMNPQQRRWEQIQPWLTEGQHFRAAIQSILSGMSQWEGRSCERRQASFTDGESMYFIREQDETGDTSNQSTVTFRKQIHDQDKSRDDVLKVVIVANQPTITVNRHVVFSLADGEHDPFFTPEDLEQLQPQLFDTLVAIRHRLMEDMGAGRLTKIEEPLIRRTDEREAEQKKLLGRFVPPPADVPH